MSDTDPFTQMQNFFVSNANIENKVVELVRLANNEQVNTERIETVMEAIIAIFSDVYPWTFQVRPFGSRITGLATKESTDLDLFIDTSFDGPDKTLVDCREMENYYLRKLAQHMRNDASTWNNVIQVLTCRTPIVKAQHILTNMQFDITVKNGLGNVNTELISLFVRNIQKFRPMVLMIREWSFECNFDKKIINHYSLSLLVLFYLQQENYAPPVFHFEYCYEEPRMMISGYECIKYNYVRFDWKKEVKSTNNVPLKQLLIGFFTFYASFDFANLIICPLLGKPINKTSFTNDGRKLPTEMHYYKKKLKNIVCEIFQISRTGINLQDPIDLCHNLTRNISASFLNYFISMCTAAKDVLENMN